MTRPWFADDERIQAIREARKAELRNAIDETEPDPVEIFLSTPEVRSIFRRFWA